MPETNLELMEAASACASLIVEASELVNVKVKLERVASDFEVSLAAGGLGESGRGYSPRIVSIPAATDGELASWLDGQAIPKLVDFSPNASQDLEKSFGAAELADFSLVPRDAPDELKRMVSLATNGDYFLSDSATGDFAPANPTDRSDKTSKVGQNQKVTQKEQSLPDLDLKIFGFNESTPILLDAAAELAKTQRNYLLKVTWDPQPSELMASFESSNREPVPLAQSERFKPVADIWALIKAHSLFAGKDIAIVTNTKGVLPEGFKEQTKELQKYVAKFPTLSKSYSFESKSLNENDNWLVLTSGDKLREIDNKDLLCGERQIADLLKAALLKHVFPRFVLLKPDQTAAGEEVAIHLLRSPDKIASNDTWVRRALQRSETTQTQDSSRRENIACDILDPHVAHVLHGLAWLRRLEVAGKEIAEKTLTDHVAYARWEQSRFEQHHQRESETELNSVEAANQKLQNLVINIPLEAKLVQDSAVDKFVQDVNTIQAEIDGPAFKKSASDISEEAERKVKDVVASQNKSESDKSTREAVIEAVASALQAPMRFLLPFAFLIVPLIVLIVHADPSKTDQSILQNTLRTYGFVLLPLFFLVAAASRFLALRDKKERQEAIAREVRRAELMSRLSKERLECVASNKTALEKRMAERARQRADEGKRIERRLSTLENVRSRMLEAVANAQKLRSNTFSELPVMRMNSMV